MKSRNKPFFALASLTALALVSCGSSAPAVQIFVYDGADPFVQSLSSGIVANLRGYLEANIQDAARKQTTQNDQFLQSLDAPETRILIMNIVDRLASSALIEKAEKKNLPLIFINREPLPDDLNVDPWAQANCFYIGSDPAYEGVLQGDIASSILGPASDFPHSKWDKNGDGRVQVAILKGEMGHQDSESRTQYCVSQLNALGYDVDVIDTQYANWERAKAYEAMKTMYDPTAEKPIELLFSNNDEMALGAIQYLEEASQPASSSSSDSSLPSSAISSSFESSASSSSSSSVPDLRSFAERFFPIIGVDATTAGREAVAEGTLAGTVLNDAAYQAIVIKDIVHYLIDETAIPAYREKVSVNGHYYLVKGETVTKNT